MVQKRPFSKVPSAWIYDGRLREFDWRPGQGSDNLASLMTYIAIVSLVDSKTGEARITYNDLMLATGISRAKTSKALEILEEKELIFRQHKSSHISLAYYGTNHRWGKIASKIHTKSSKPQVKYFDDFKLRKKIELDALKILLLVVATRNVSKNLSEISYDKITEYTGIARTRIKPAMGLLMKEAILIPERHRFSDSGRWYIGYRLNGVDSFVHAGTIDSDLLKSHMSILAPF